MIKKIAICVSLSVIVSFGLLLLVQNYFPEEQIILEREFYSQNFPSNKQMIVLMGSSHVGQLNSTLIQEKISQNNSRSLVYNLSYNGDTPSERIETINKIIEINPKIVLYGISYRDFVVDSKINHPLPDPQIFFNDLLLDQVGSHNKLNPKYTTLEIIRENLASTNLFPKNEPTRIDNSPFVKFTSEQTIIVNQSILKQQGKNLELQNPINIIPTIKNQQIKDFESIIKILKDNDIEIIVFSTPLHQYSLEHIPVENKINFSKIIEKIENNYNIKVYDFSEKYVDQNIWANINHVSFNKKASIYSEDISNIIINEMNN